VSRKLRQLRADLQRGGFYLDHQTGSHQIWKHPLIAGISVNLVGKDSADAKPYQERELREAIRKLQEVQRQQGRHTHE
jgi:predicted RNA binding protein YcfA (HicA-like mRNA interferase family)